MCEDEDECISACVLGYGRGRTYMWMRGRGECAYVRTMVITWLDVWARVNVPVCVGEGESMRAHHRATICKLNALDSNLICCSMSEIGAKRTVFSIY